MVEHRRYHPEALASALALVCRATSVQTARVFEALIRARSGKRSADAAGLSELGARGHTEAFHSRIRTASSEFAAAFGIPLIHLIRPPFNEDSDLPGAVCSGDSHGSIWLAPAFLNVLDRPTAEINPVGAPEPDVLTATWVAIAGGCPSSGRGHHFALRCLRFGPREPADIARLIAARAANVHLFADDTYSLELAVLRAELHGGSAPAVVVVDRHMLSEPSEEGDDALDRPFAVSRDRLLANDSERLRIFRGLRNTYVWRAPLDFAIDGELAAFFGGAIGPLIPTHEWRDAVIADFAPGIGRDGVRALAASVADPRDTGALAAAASVAVSVFGIDLDSAAVLVASSLSPERLHAPRPPDFDARLIVCDEEGQLLLARAAELARQGARILFWGPPGGGKSTFAQALAAAMGRDAQTVTGAAILARGWGVTERLIADLWSRAADDSVCLIIAEIDSLCGVREPRASSGNAYLVRSLTNEFLRAFDVYRTVPVIATANRLESIDEAVRRRFTFVVNVQGELTPEAERLAWHSVFDVDPPPGWVPIGANVSDFANAVRRCRMLGLLDAESLAAAVERSREARLGPTANVRHDRSRLQ